MSSVRDQIGAAIAAPAMMAFEGESVVYTPKGGSPETVRAVVNRQPIGTASSDGGRINRYKFEVTLRREDVPDLNVGGDTLAFKNRLTDASSVTRIIQTVISNEAGMVRVGLS